MTSFYLLLLIVSSALASEQCAGGDGECADGGCLDASAFRARVASFERGDDSLKPLLRGTAEDVISQEEIDSLVELLPKSEFVGGAGYEDNRAYSAPVAFSGLGLGELSTSNEARYNKLLEVRERVRSATERSLGLCPGTLLVDFTHVTQKTVGGQHRAHADNCLHYFDEKTGRATCDTTQEHPYADRVAASIFYLNDYATGNFAEGEFYFADRNYGRVDEIVPVETGKMVYFTSGVEGLHGALPVQPRTDGNDYTEPRRLVLAMWYVFDKESEEYVPPFREEKKSVDDTNDEGNPSQSKAKPRKVYDPDDPTAPKELFAVPIPNGMDIEDLFRSMGEYLITQQNDGAWKVNKYGEDALHVLFKDHSAMFSLEFGVELPEPLSSPFAESGMVIERHTDGRKPASLQYMLQESVMLHGVLDAFSNLVVDALDGDGREYFVGAVEGARGLLPARRA